MQRTNSRGQSFGKGSNTTTKIEFSALADFIEEVRAAKIDVVRFDVFETAEKSELSFIYYVTVTMYVTAQSFSGRTLYEYREWLGTAPSADRHFQDDVLEKLVQARSSEVRTVLAAASCTVKAGRFVIQGPSPED